MAISKNGNTTVWLQTMLVPCLSLPFGLVTICPQSDSILARMCHPTLKVEKWVFRPFKKQMELAGW